MTKKNVLIYTASVRVPKNASPSELRKAQKELERTLKTISRR